MALAQEAETPEAQKRVEASIDRYLAGEERKLQADCERWLQLHGWWPRTPDFIARGKPPTGWYIHLHEAKRNPILLDLLLLRNDGRYVEVELKTCNGKLSSEQAVLVGSGGRVVRDLVQFIGVVGEIKT
jgi:hypothetical protein